MNFAYQLPVVQPWLGEGLHKARMGGIPTIAMQLDYVDAPPVIIIEGGGGGGGGGGERPHGGEPTGTVEESDSPGGGS